MAEEQFPPLIAEESETEGETEEEEPTVIGIRRIGIGRRANKTSSQEEPTVEEQPQEALVLSPEEKKELREAVEKLKLKGNTFYSGGSYQAALDAYEEALESNSRLEPDEYNLDMYIKLKNNITLTYTKKLNFKSAARSVLDAITAKSTSAKTYIKASEIFDKLGNPKLAYLALKKGMELTKGNELEAVSKGLKELKTKYPSVAQIPEQDWVNVDLYTLARRVISEVPHTANNQGKDDQFISESSDDGEDEYSLPETGKPKRKMQRDDRERKAQKKKEASNAAQKKAHEAKVAAAAVAEKVRKVKEENAKKAEEIAKKEEESQKTLKVSVAEEKKRKEEEERLKSLDQCQHEFRKLIKDGSFALQNNVALTSVDFMSKALDMMRTKYNHLGWLKNVGEKENPEALAIRYVYGRACIETNIYENIIHAKESFECILTFKIRFPAVHYGLALLFKKLNRYDESKKHVTNGLTFLDKGISFAVINWPGLPAQPILETIKENLFSLLTDLSAELAEPLKAGAVCRYHSCLTHKEQTHILPSENIYMSDPDYRGHYMVHCRELCRLEYHKTCWYLVKQHYQTIWKLPKVPTEKDFLGKNCFTPDCEGMVVKIEIYDQDGVILPIEDSKLIKKIESEEKRRKEEERIKREEQQQKNKNKNDNKKKRKKKKSETDLEEINAKENVPIKPVEDAAVAEPPPTYSNQQIDYSQVDLSKATIVKKKAVNTEQEEEEEIVAKKKKSNKKITQSLGEFIGAAAVERNPQFWPGNSSLEEDDFNSRVARANALKISQEKIREVPEAQPDTFNIGGKEYKTFQSSDTRQGWAGPGPEVSNSGQPVNYSYNNQPVNSLFAAGLLNDYNNDYWTRNCTLPPVPFHVKDIDSSPYGVPPIMTSSRERRSSVKSTSDKPASSVSSSKGTSRCVSPTITEDIKQSIWTFLEGLLRTSGPLHYDDPRIQDHIDSSFWPLIRGKENFTDFLMVDPQARFRVFKTYVSLINDLAKAIQLYTDETHLVEQTSALQMNPVEKGETSSEDIWRQMKERLHKTTDRSQQSRGSANTLTAGVQTDVSSIDLDDIFDPFTLQQTNTELVEELQQTKDRVTKIQNDRKIEMKELVEKNKTLSDEVTKLKNENGKLRDENFKIKRTLNESGDKDRELKTLHQELDKTKKDLEMEQRLSYDWRNKSLSLNEENQTLKQSVKTLKEFNLMVEYKYYINLVESKRTQNSKAILYLEELRHHPDYFSHAHLIAQGMKDLDEYAAKLLSATDELNLLLESKKRLLHSSMFISLDFDDKKIQPPKLSSDLFLLILDVSGPLQVPTARSAGQPLRYPVPGMALSMPQGFAAPPPGIRVSNRPPGYPVSPEHNSSRPKSAPGNPTGSPARHSRYAFANGAPPPDIRPPPLFSGESSRSATPLMEVQSGRSEAVSPFRSRAGDTLGEAGYSAPGAVGSAPGSAAQGRAMSSASDISGGGGVSLKKKHSVLIDKLKDKLGLSTQDANRYLSMLREENGGKLSGMSMNEMFPKVVEIQKREENICAICMEMMNPNLTETLDPCKHTFCTGCIHQWLNMEKSGNLCPICRHYIAKEDEFPDLNSQSRRQR